MDILVFVKQVPDDFVKVGLGADGKPDCGKIEKVVNAFDTYAVEMAVRFCETNGGTVVVASLGEEGTIRPSLVQMIAVGAGQAYIGRWGSADGGDESMVAAALAELVKKCEEAQGCKFDIILCGKESTDEISSQVGAMLAEKLGTGFVSSVVGMEPAGTGLQVKKETEEGFDIYETACPAVFTVAKPDYDPRYPTLKSKMAARKAVIPCIETAACEEGPFVRCIRYGEMPKRAAGMKIREKEALAAVEKAVQMMRDDKVL